MASDTQKDDANERSRMKRWNEKAVVTVVPEGRKKKNETFRESYCSANSRDAWPLSVGFSYQVPRRGRYASLSRSSTFHLAQNERVLFSTKWTKDVRKQRRCYGATQELYKRQTFRVRID